MPRWRQNPKTLELEEIKIDSGASPESATVRGDFEPFVSPIDGTVISGRKSYDEHCKKHNVVPAAEFTPEFYERKAKERADHYTGQKSKGESLEIKRMIYENWVRAEREHGCN